MIKKVNKTELIEIVCSIGEEKPLIKKYLRLGYVVMAQDKVGANFEIQLIRTKDLWY